MHSSNNDKTGPGCTEQKKRATGKEGYFDGKKNERIEWPA